MKHPPQNEQADGIGGRSRSYHQYLKKKTTRCNRAYVRNCLKRRKEPINNDRKYYGYET